MSTMQQLSASQANKETRINENFLSIEHQSVYGYDPTTSSGLVRGYYGGRWGGFAVAAGTFTLAASNTTYIVVALATGVTTASTVITNWNTPASYVRVYKLTTSASAVTAEEDHRSGASGVHGGTITAGSGAVATDAIWDAAGDLVQGTGSNTAARLPIGTALQVLRVNAGATAVEWAADVAGSVATDAVWDAAGDLVQGTGADTAARLALGTALQVLRVNAGATAAEWAAPAAPTSRVGLAFEKELPLSDLTTAITTGTTKAYFRPAFAATGVSYRASLRVASSSGLPTVDMNKNGSTMASTKLTIDASETTSQTAATPVVMSTTTWAIDDLIEWDIDVAGTGAMGLVVTATGLYA